jgi:hypothetical protein
MLRATLLAAFLLVCAAELIAGWMLWQGRRAGIMLAIALLPVEFVFWIGFALPFGPTLGVAPTRHDDRRHHQSASPVSNRRARRTEIPIPLTRRGAVALDATRDHSLAIHLSPAATASAPIRSSAPTPATRLLRTNSKREFARVRSLSQCARTRRFARAKASRGSASNARRCVWETR